MGGSTLALSMCVWNTHSQIQSQGTAFFQQLVLYSLPQSLRDRPLGYGYKTIPGFVHPRDVFLWVSASFRLMVATAVRTTQTTTTTTTTGVHRSNLQEHRPETNDRQRPTRRRRCYRRSRGRARGDVPVRDAVPQALQGRHPCAAGDQARGIQIVQLFDILRPSFLLVFFSQPHEDSSIAR